MNSSRAPGCQPQNRHFVQTGSMTRLQPPQIFWLGGAELFRASTKMTTSNSTAPPTMMPTSGPVSTSVSRALLVDRLELEVGLAERDHVVVDELVLGDLAVVDVATVRRSGIDEDEALRRCLDLAVLRAHEAVVDDDVRRRRGADLRTARAQAERLVRVVAVERHEPADDREPVVAAARVEHDRLD